jgi:cysteine-rich repeat protein
MKRSIALVLSLVVVACLNDNAVDGPYVGAAPVVDAGPACPAGEVICDETGFLLKICDDDNESFNLVPCGDDEYCSAGRCEEQICAPNEMTCQGRSTQLCNEFGGGFVRDRGTNCEAADMWCRGGECVRDLCEPDCNNTQYCSDEGECRQRVCAPDQRICDGAEARLCNRIGSAFAETTDCAEDNRLCHYGVCVDAGCGNGTLEDDEICDDGNLVNTDACTNDCRPAVCGDGFLRDGVEECDDANQLQTDACLTDCTVASCGDGHVQAGIEGCDDGNPNDADGCDTTCRDTTSPLSLGAYSNCILRAEIPYCMGLNIYGSVGDGTSANRSQPTQMLDLVGVVQLSGTYFTQCALKSDGTVWCWGRNNWGQLGDGTNVDRSQPVQVVTLTNIVELDGNSRHYCARRDDGTVWCWGYNAHGQMGDGTTTNRNRPVQVSGINNTLQISAGAASCARLGDGTTWCWGFNGRGQVGDGTNTLQRDPPVRVSNDGGFIDLQAGYHHTCARKANGTLWCWGYNAHGELGDGTTTNRNAPTQVLNVSDATAVAVGGMYKTCAIRAGGLMWCWGRNQSGQLGDGTTTQRSAPVRVIGLGAVTHMARGGAGKGNFARTVTGETYAWGYNYYGSLGLGDANIQNYPTPQRVPGF